MLLWSELELRAAKVLEARIMQRIKKIEGPFFSECWIWQGAVRGGDLPYGEIGFREEVFSTHRMMWIAKNKRKIPHEMHVMHKCNNSLCCNPLHLQVGTPQDNSDTRVEEELWQVN